MKETLLALLFLAGPAVLGWAEAPRATAPCPSCDKGASRLAALTGAAACPADCQKVCCQGEKAVFEVAGMEKDGRATEVQEALVKQEGISVEKVCHNSGIAVVKYDPKATTPAKLARIIAGTGATVQGQVLSFQVAGMTCTGCSAKLTKVLAGTDGVTKVKSVSHETGAATLLIDPAKTDHARITAVINKSGYKVQEG